MYVWLWRRLPGGRPAKSALALALLLVVLALLFLVVFPWVEPRLPWNRTTVTGASVAIFAPPGGHARL